MTENDKPIRSPTSMKLASLKDLIKLVLSSVGPDRVSGYIGYYEYDDKVIYFIFNTSIGYYDLNSLPVVMWVNSDDKPGKSFIRYTTSPKETLEFSNDANDPKWLSIPIVKFEILPEFFKVWEKEN